MSEVVVSSQTNLRNEVRYGAGHSFITDEPIRAGGEDAGPDPYTLLLAALGSCNFDDSDALRAAQTVAARKGYRSFATESHARERL